MILFIFFHGDMILLSQCFFACTIFLWESASLDSATLLKKRLWHRCFPLNLAKLLRTPFFTEHLRANASILGRNRSRSQMILLITFLSAETYKFFSKLLKLSLTHQRIVLLKQASSEYRKIWIYLILKIISNHQISSIKTISLNIW